MKCKFKDILTEEFFSRPEIINLSNTEIGEKIKADCTTIKKYRLKFNLMSERSKSYLIAKKLRNISLPSYQYGLITGLLFGDASLLNSGKQFKDIHFSIGHGPAQIDYLIFLGKLFNNLFPRDIKLSKSKQGYEIYYLSSISNHPDLINLRKSFYDENGRKMITRDNLDLLSIPGLVLWYYDDGTKLLKSFGLATCCFNLEEHNLIQECLFYKFGLETSINSAGKKGYYSLYFKRGTSYIMDEFLKEYYIPCMKYKLHLYALPTSETIHGDSWNLFLRE